MAKQGKPSKQEGLATIADLGLDYKEIHEAREVRDAEEADPGIVRRVLDDARSRLKVFSATPFGTKKPVAP